MNASTAQALSEVDRGLNEYLKDALLESCKEAIRPLIRLCLKHGISYEDFTRALRYVFVDSAHEDYLDEKSSSSRVAILTGLARREVEEIEAVEPESKIVAARMATAGQILSAWHSDPEFTGPYGIPLELTFEGSGSFSDLVEKYGNGMPPGEVLEELLRVGCAVRGKGGTVSVLRRSFLSEQLDPVSVNYLGKTLRGLAETLEFNLGRQDSPDKRFERQFISTSGIRASDLDAFLELLQEAGQKFLEDLDSWTTEREKALKKLEKVPNEIPRVFPGVGLHLFFNTKPVKRATGR